MQGFIFGSGTDVPSYEALKKKRELADLLTKQATERTPQNVGEGIAAIGRAIAARYLDKKIGPQEAAARQAAMDQLMQIRGGMGPEGITPDQFQGLGGILENDYAAPMVEALARSLMRRKLMATNGEEVTLDPSAPQMNFAAAEGGQTTPFDLQQAIQQQTRAQAVSGQPMTDTGVMDMQQMFQNMPGNRPMSGAGEPLAAMPDGGGVQVAENAPLKLTEGQSRDLGFWNRMDGVSADLDRFESTLTDAGERTKGSIPLVGNALVSEDYQRGRRAAEEWVAGILRKDTGAAVTKEEMDRYDKIYIPQAFDDPATVEDKRAARQRAMESLKKGLGIAEILADELAAARAKSAAPEPNDGDADLFKKYGIEP